MTKEEENNKPKTIESKKSREDYFNNELDVLKRLLDVKTIGIKDDLNEDYVLMHGGESKEEFIKENLQGSYYAKNLIMRYKTGTKPHWNIETQDWDKNEDGSLTLYPLSDNEIKKVEETATKLFDFLMLNSHSLAVLNRNKDANFIVKLLGRHREENEGSEMMINDGRNLLQKGIDKLRGRESVEYVDE